MSDEDLRAKFALLPRPITDRDLYVQLFMGTGENIPSARVCPDHHTPWDFLRMAYFNEHASILAIGPRKGGKTKTVAKLLYAWLLNTEGIELANVGAISKQAKKCYKYVKGFLERSCPDRIVKITQEETVLTNEATYAQLVGTVAGVNCLSGDTLIDCPRDLSQYPEGVPLKSLVGKTLYVWSYDIANDRFCLRQASNIRKTGEKVPVYKVYFDWKKRGRAHKGKTFSGALIGTSEHPILLKDGTYKPIGQLVAGDSLQPFYQGFTLSDSLKYGTRKLPGRWVRVGKNQLVEEYTAIYQELFGPVPKGSHIHHRNFKHQDNRPENLECLTKEEHCRLHFGPDYQAHITALSRRQMSQTKTKNNVEPVWQSREWLAAELSSGKSIGQIERELKVTGITIWAKRFGLRSAQRTTVLRRQALNNFNQAIRDRQGSPYKRSKYYQGAKYRNKPWLAGAIEQKKPLSAIAEHCGVSSDTIWYWATKFGLIQKTRRDDPELRAKLSAAASKRYQDPEQRILSSLKAKERANCPAYRQWLSTMMKQAWANGRPYRRTDMTIEGNHKVVAVRFAGYQDVYDMEIEDTHNFIANGIVVHNSPHPVKLMADEVELMKPEVLEELLLVPASDTVRKIPRSVIMTSTRKYAYGLVQTLLDDKDSDFHPIAWCYKEIAEPCPLERRGFAKKKYTVKDIYHQNDSGEYKERDIIAFENCGKCRLLPSCRGDLARSQGYMPIDDLIRDFKLISINTWIYQMECRKASSTGKVFPTFDEIAHTGYFPFNPNLPIDVIVDMGFDHPAAVLFIQEDEETEHGYCVNEIYQSGMTTDIFAREILRILEGYGLKWNHVRNGIGDSEQAQQIADLQQYGIYLEPTRKIPVEMGLEYCRHRLYSLSQGVRYHIDRRHCPHHIQEFKDYHYKRGAGELVVKEAPVSKNDHTMACFRYWEVYLQQNGAPAIRTLDY